MAASNSVLLTPYTPRWFNVKNMRLSVLGVTTTSVQSATGAFLDGSNIGSASNYYGMVPLTVTPLAAHSCA